MRFLTLFVLTVAVGVTAGARADGLITKLPADGTWALYAIKETITDPNRAGEKPLTVSGTLKLASIGSEMVKGEACCWIELVLDANLPGAKESQVTVFKALIPEKFLAKGQDPRTHWLKGWMKLGDRPAQALTPEQLSAPILKLNLFVCGPLQETKELKEKVVETGVGKLTCKGISGILVLKGGSVQVKQGQAEVRDARFRMERYFHGKAPFGVAYLRGVMAPEAGGEREPTSVAECTLSRAGKDAKSVLPENN
jgi:hypothetical protein